MPYGCERGTIPQASSIMQRHVSDEVDRRRRRVVNIVKFCEASATNPLAPHSKRAARRFGGGRGADQGFPRPKCLSLSSPCKPFSLSFPFHSWPYYLAVIDCYYEKQAQRCADLAWIAYHMPARKASRQGNIHLCTLCGGATSILTRARCSARSPRTMLAEVDGYGRARAEGLACREPHPASRRSRSGRAKGGELPPPPWPWKKCGLPS